MSLDKQRILNELGSVMNQLQSADCGCMGKLFGNSNQNGSAPCMNSTYGGGRHNCCRNFGYNAGQYGVMQSNNNMGESAMPNCRCNPAKMYADTYSYLNQNLMQPTVQEVYNDLKTITPANTVTNSPLASQMGKGMTPGSINGLENSSTALNPMGMVNMNHNTNAMHQMNPIGGQMGTAMIPGQMSGNVMGNQGFVGQNLGHSEGNMDASKAYQQQMAAGAGKGPDIMNMMMMKGHGDAKPINSQMGGKLTEQMIIDAPHSPHGKVGVQPLSMGQSMQQQRSEVNYNVNPNTYTALQNSSNVAPNQHSQPNAHLHNRQMHHGHNTAGPGMKFHEMFPGVMKTFGEDLGFDPMAIAIQMNPENAKRSAMDTMQNMMMGNQNKNVLKQASPNSLQATSNAPIAEEQHMINNTNINQENNISVNESSRLIGQPNQVQQAYTAETNEIKVQEPVSSNNPYVPSTQMTNQQEMKLDSSPQDTIAYNALTTDPNLRRREPIFPVDTSKNVHTPIRKAQSYQYYNTLGQPVEQVPAEMYHIPQQSLPQTLSPPPIPIKKLLSQNRVNSSYSNVKSTVSKTSLIGQNVNKSASKSQLQHLYNQYKSSPSYTQQNTRHNQGGSQSDGQLNEKHANIKPNLAPLEKVAGDTLANDYLNDKIENKINELGDVPVQNRADKIPMYQANNLKSHNGLQDITFTSYPATTAWSFYGRH